MLRELKIVNDPQVLVVTPLWPGHKISRNTKISIKRNDIEYDWISYEDKNNIPTNVNIAINEYDKSPLFFIMIDRDITLGRNALDKLSNKLINSNENVGYAYPNLKFEGYQNRYFPARPFNITDLIKQNYITSNSMIKFDYLLDVGLVMDEKYKRLLDWALWLKFFQYGYIGVACPNVTFVANSTKDDISSGSKDDYMVKYNRVKRDFIDPLLNSDVTDIPNEYTKLKGLKV